ncbi:hypothetical protein D9M72_657140 [compost metagenome]
MGRGGSSSLWSPGIRGCSAEVEVNAANRDVVGVVRLVSTVSAQSRSHTRQNTLVIGSSLTGN